MDSDKSRMRRDGILQLWRLYQQFKQDAILFSKYIAKAAAFQRKTAYFSVKFQIILKKVKKVLDMPQRVGYNVGVDHSEELECLTQARAVTKVDKWD